MYGPSLPKKKHKKYVPLKECHKWHKYFIILSKRHKSRSSRGDDAIDLCSLSSSPTGDSYKRRNSSKKDKHRHRSRSGSRKYTERSVTYLSQTSGESSSLTSGANSKESNAKGSEKVRESESDEEDLEDFFNSLKKNKTIGMANRK